MSKKELLYLLLFTVGITCLFFAKVIFLHQIPFPADLLVDTSPFKTQSYLGYGPGGYPNKAQGRDVIAQLYPWKTFSISQFKNGSIPLWNPYNFSGNAHIANYQTGVFYPLNIVFFILPFNFAWTVFIMLQPILSLVFMYLFLRSLKVSILSSLIGSFAFAFSSYMTVWLEWGNIGHTLLWLPLMLFSIRKYIFTKKFPFSVLFVVSAICCLLAGYIQGAFYVFLVTALYGFFLLLHKKEKKLWIIVPGLFIISLAVAAIQILPTIALFLSSTRDAYSPSQIQNLLNPVYYVVTLFASEFFGNPATRNFSLPITYFERVMYIGIPILFFAFYGFQKVRNFEIKFFGILAGVALLVTTNIPGIRWIYSLPIPVLSTTVPTRFLSIFIFSSVVVAIFGIEYWIKKKDFKSWIPYIFGGVYIVLWIGLFISAKIYPQWSTEIAVAKHNLILSTAIAGLTILIFFLRYKFVKISSMLLGLLAIADLFYIFMKFTPFSPASLIYPTTPVIQYLQESAGINRSWGYGNAYIPANYTTEFGIYSADGYDSLFSENYGRLLNSSSTGKIQIPLSRTDANIPPGNGFNLISANFYRQKILNLLGVKYILHVPFSGDTATPETGVFPDNIYSFVWHDKNYQLYENRQVFPRFFLANTFEVVNEHNDIFQIYTTDLRKTILLYQHPEKNLTASASGKVILNSYRPNTIRFTTNTSGNELLFLSDTYDTGWVATIDGKATKVYKADVAFRAVEVPKGKHTVILYYQPWSFDIGMAVSLLVLTVGGSYLVARKLLK